jgi:hypothetical protein
MKGREGYQSIRGILEFVVKDDLNHKSGGLKSYVDLLWRWCLTRIKFASHLPAPVPAAPSNIGGNAWHSLGRGGSQTTRRSCEISKALCHQPTVSCNITYLKSSSDECLPVSVFQCREVQILELISPRLFSGTLGAKVLLAVLVSPR